MISRKFNIHFRKTRQNCKYSWNQKLFCQFKGPLANCKDAWENWKILICKWFHEKQQINFYFRKCTSKFLTCIFRVVWTPFFKRFFHSMIFLKYNQIIIFNQILFKAFAVETDKNVWIFEKIVHELVRHWTFRVF